MKIYLNKTYVPNKDVVFSLMFEQEEFFKRLFKAITGDTVKLKGKPISQAHYNSNHPQLNSIRFDTLATDTIGNILTIDMQRSYSSDIIRNRTVYYACRGVSNQKVQYGRYDELKSICVSFIMAKQGTNDSPVKCIQLLDTNTHQVYNNLIKIYEVYAPSVTATTSNDDLYVLSRFFSIENVSMAEAFCDEFKGNAFAEKIVNEYNKIIADTKFLDEQGRSEYFMERIDEKTIQEEITKEKVTIAKRLLDLELDVESIAKATGLSIQDVEEIKYLES